MKSNLISVIHNSKTLETKFDKGNRSYSKTPIGDPSPISSSKKDPINQTSEIDQIINYPYYGKSSALMSPNREISNNQTIKRIGMVDEVLQLQLDAEDKAKKTHFLNTRSRTQKYKY